MSAAAIITKQNRMMRRFVDAGATSLASARVPEEIGCRRGWIFRRMASAGVFVPTGNGQFYLDEVAAEQFRGRRRTRGIIALLVVILLVIVGLLVMHR